MMSRSENFLQTSHYASLWPLASSYKPCTSPSILIHPFFTFFSSWTFQIFRPRFFLHFCQTFPLALPAPFFAAAFFMWRVWLGCSICVVNYEKAKSHSSSSFSSSYSFSSFPPHPPLKGRVGASPPFPPFNLLTAVSHYPRVPPSGNLSAKNTLRVDLLRKIPLNNNIYSISNILQISNFNG